MLSPDMYYSGEKTITLPESVEQVGLHTGWSIKLKSLKNLKLVRITWNIGKISVEKNESKDSQYDIDVAGSVGCPLDGLSVLLTNGLRKLNYKPTHYILDYVSDRILDCTILANANKCSEMIFSYITVKNLDGTYFPDSVKNLAFSNCKLTNFKNLGKLTRLNSLTLDNNLFSVLPDFYELSEDCSLTTLNLSNNSLQNYTSVSVDGVTYSYKTCYILSRFRNLTSIDLSGNLDLTDFSSLTSSENGFKAYKDDGKHKFTRD